MFPLSRLVALAVVHSQIPAGLSSATDGDLKIYLLDLELSRAHDSTQVYFLPAELLNFGRALIRDGDVPGGLALLRVSTEVYPEHVHGRVVLSEAYEGLGRVLEAREAFDRALALDEAAPRAVAGRARLSGGEG